MNRSVSILTALLFCAVSCIPASAQIVVDSSMNFKVTNVNSGLVLGIAGASLAANANAVQNPDTGATARRHSALHSRPPTQPTTQALCRPHPCG